MTLSLPNASRSCSTEGSLAELIEELSANIEAGETVDLSAYLAGHPEHADELRRLFPALQLLADFSRSGAASVPPVIHEDADGEAPGRLGDFRIIREVGRGGMGVVYEAEQISLGRRVALKVLPFAATMDPRQLQRFQNEAHAAAQLHHTNIVPVYAVGCERGVHFYAMQFIEGRTLAAVVHELRQASQPGPTGSDAATLPAGRDSVATAPIAGLSTERSAKDPAYFRMVAQLGIQAAEALEYAHQEGILHRDIKPANLLLDAKGRLWITDFGLACFQGDPRLTVTGDLVGTLRYMSPEQALGKRDLVDQRSDIYSLGVTLYELLTLQPAFPSSDRQKLLSQLATDEPTPPRRLNSAIPVELETILLKSIAKEPSGRYATAQALADDLKNFLEHKPIRARRPTLWEQVRKWSRRHRGVVATAITAVFVLLLFAVVALAVGNFLISRERSEARRQRDEAAKQRKVALDNLRAIIAEINDLDTRRPDLFDIRRDLLLRFQKHLRSILDDPEHAALADETDFWLEIDIGDIFRGYQDRIQEARVHYQRALQIAARVPDDADGGRTRRRLRSFAVARLGDVYALEGRSDDAMEQYRETLALREELGTPDRVAKADLAAAHLSTGRGCRWMLGGSDPSAFTKANEHLLRSHKLYMELAREFPDDFEYCRMLGYVWKYLADLRTDQGDWARGLEELREGLEFLRQARQRFPDREMGLNTPHVGWLLEHQCLMLQIGGQFARAQAAAEELVKLRSDVVDRHPIDPHVHSLIHAYGLMAGSWRGQGRHDLARANYDKTLALSERLKESIPVPTLDVLIDIGELIEGAEDGVLRFAEERIGWRRRAFNSGDRNPIESRALFETLAELGDFHLLRGRPVEASRRYQEAIQFSQQVNELAWSKVEGKKLDRRLEICKGADKHDFCPCAELVGLAGKPAHLIIMQREFQNRKDHARLAKVSEQLVRESNHFTPLYAAARGFAQAAAIAPAGMDRERYGQRCTDLVKRLLRFGGEVNERLRQDPDLARYTGTREKQ